MGVYDDYCLICGGPIRAPEDEFTVLSKKEEKKYIKDNKLTVDTKFFKKESFDGDAAYTPFTLKYLKWVEKLLVITNDGVFNTEIEEDGVYKTDKKLYCSVKSLVKDKKLFNYSAGVVCHKVCYNIIKKELGISIKYKDIEKKIDNYLSVLKNKNVYKDMKKYSFTHFFEYFSCLIEDPWLLDIKNKKNIERILGIWRKILK